MINREKDLRFCMPARYKEIPIHLYDTLDSTNNYAKQLAANNAPHGTVVMARRQTAGRGRLGRSFFSPEEGIYISIIIRPSIDLNKATLATCAAAVAVAESIEEICGIPTGIKWVNDVYVNGKKICGILTEGVTDFETGQLKSLVIGIGVNTSLREFPKELLNIAGAVEGNYSRPQLASAIISKTLDLTENMEDRSFIKAYREKSLIIGKTVNVFQGAYVTDPTAEMPARPARVLDIDENGGLVVLYTDGSRQTLISGEISIRI